MAVNERDPSPSAPRAEPAKVDPRIDELRARLHEVAERERRLRLALLASDDEIWEYAVAEDRIAFEHEMTGNAVSVIRDEGANPMISTLAPKVVRGAVNLDTFVSTVHPEHRDVLRTALAALTQGRSEFEEITIRRQRRGGGWVWVQLHGRVAAVDADGKPALIVGSARDITGMQHNADRLRLALMSAGEELWDWDLASNRNRRENPLPHTLDAAYEQEPATDVFTRMCHPDDIAHINQIFLDVRSGRQREFHAVYRSRGTGGSWRWMDSQGRGIDPDDQGRPTRVIGTIRDITELKEGEQRLRTVLWGSGAELWDIDLVAGNVHRSHMIPGLKINSLGETIAFADLMSRVSPEHAGMIRDGMVAQVKGLSEKFEVWFRLEAEDGAWRWLYSHGKVTERGPDGRALRLAGTLHDVSAMKKIEDELRVLNEQLEQRVAERTAELTGANAELNLTIQRLDETRAQLVESEKMASLGSLVAGVSHEINTPLGVGITGASQLLEEVDALARDLAGGNLDPRQLAERVALMHECGELVQRSLLRTDKLVRSFKQVAVKQSVESPRRFVLAELIDAAVLPFAGLLAHGQHTVSVDGAGGIELDTYANALQQVLTALLANSLEHATVPEKPLAIAIRVLDAGEDVAIDYRDDGAGMPREVRLRIFDPFFTTRRSHGSLGLGMHIVYNLVTQRLAGRIRCDSEPAAGARFTVRLPRRVPDA
ncbi:MAG: PAS domain-containing protein [Proteobacteria bacterium]|nr:PAS domain-containing protein [Pseudomonadota bacterium]